jgi:hypothetical protein
MDEVGGGMGGLLVADRPAPFLPVRPPARPNPGISVVIPVYNSETTIEPLCEDIIRDLGVRDRTG